MKPPLTARDNRRHAIMRARRRYHIQLNRHTYRDLVQQVREGSGLYVGRRSNRLTVWVVYHDYTPLLALYDKDRSAIATFLPIEAFKRHGLSWRTLRKERRKLLKREGV